MTAQVKGSKRFRKRPTVVEAEQWQPGKLILGVITDPSHLVGVAGAHIGHQRELDGRCGVIITPEGLVFVNPGDWIVTDTNGKKYPCKPDIFEAVYEPE